MTYYNTTNETGKALEVNTKKALSQEEKVKELFRLHIQFTPSRLHLMHFSTNTPLTSVRRAISNLCKQCFLVKTDTKVIGRYGKPEWIYRLNKL